MSSRCIIDEIGISDGSVFGKQRTLPLFLHFAKKGGIMHQQICNADPCPQRNGLTGWLVSILFALLM